MSHHLRSCRAMATVRYPHRRRTIADALAATWRRFPRRLDRAEAWLAAHVCLFVLVLALELVMLASLSG